MILDYLNRFTNGLLATVRAAGNYLCPLAIDQGVVRGCQIGNPPDFVVRVGQAFAGGTSVEFQVVCADNEALSTNLDVLGSSGPIPTASLTADSFAYKGRLPQRIPRRYLGCRAVGVGTYTAGSFEAFLAERAPIDRPI